MPRRALCLPLALGLATALAACGGSRSAVTEAPPPLTSAARTDAQTVPTTATSTATSPPATSTATAPPPVTATTPAVAAPRPSTAPGGAPAGCPTAVGGFVRDVRASGVDCDRARGVAQAWYAAIRGGASPTTQIAAAGYACVGTLAEERASVRCTGAGGSAVAFSASP